MARVQASMKDVSTDFNPVEPGVYELEIRECKEHAIEDTGRISYEVVSEIVGVVSDGSPDDVGRKVTDRVHIHKRDGTLNDFGLAQLKRYFEVTVGEERANADDADTDELLNQRYRGQIVIETYEVVDSLTGNNETRKKNTINRFAPV